MSTSTGYAIIIGVALAVPLMGLLVLWGGPRDEE